METSPFPTASSQPWAEPAAASLHARAIQLLAAQQARLERAELLVERELLRLEEELAQERDQSDRLRDERDALAARLARTEAGATGSQPEPTTVPDDDDGRTPGEDYRRHYELALDDLHNLKARNAELQQQLDDASSTAASEQVIAEKDRQIRDLELRLEELEELEEHRGNIGAEVPQTAAIAQAIDSNALIQEERERLKRLQEEWREKFRQAEIELSLERAKLARQRAEMEGRLNAPENDLPKPPNVAGATGHTEQSAPGRWLARLGLTQADKEHGRH